MKSGYIASIILFALFWGAVLFVPGDKAVYLGVPTLLGSSFIAFVTFLGG